VSDGIGVHFVPHFVEQDVDDGSDRDSGRPLLREGCADTERHHMGRIQPGETVERHQTFV